MGFSEADSSKCRRHPTHRQSPGVCSSCLREKLSKLSISPGSFNRKKPDVVVSHSSSLSSTPPYSSASSSTTTTTTTTATVTTTGTRKSPGSRHRRNGSEVAYVSVGMVLNNGLKKSRSVSCAPLSSRSRLGANNDVVNDKFKTCVNPLCEVDNNNNTTNNKDKKISNINTNTNNNNLKKKNGFLKKLINSTSKKTKGVLMHSKTMRERSSLASSTTSTPHKK